jgi:hypothetical protein
MRLVKLAMMLLLGSCGGGGGGAAAPIFDVAGVTPRDGTVDASIDSDLAITFTAPMDLGSATPDSVRLETGGGAAVPGTLLVQPSSPTNLRFDPHEPLLYNSAYRLVVRGTIRAFDGTPLGADRVVRFITESPGPTVRPDQLVDLGDALRVPRFLAQAHPTPSGRIVVFGGYRSPAEVDGTAEVFDPATRTFRLVASPMLSPRAEFTATGLPDGRVLLAGGVAAPGGEPLASTEVFDPERETFAPGPPLLVGRRRHAACAFPGSGEVLVTGGVGADGAARTDGERLRNGAWTFAAGALETGTADHAQMPVDADTIYISVGNVLGKAALFDEEQIRPRQEFDGRLRTTLFKVDGNRVFVIGGDTRSIAVFDLDSGTTFPASVFLRERRGAHTSTRRGDPHRFLVAGGFNIARAGEPALDSMEVVEYLPIGPFALPDANVHPVLNLKLPRPFAGHVAGTAADGAVLLAGGFGDGVGEHSRRAVLVLP